MVSLSNECLSPRPETKEGRSASTSDGFLFVTQRLTSLNARFEVTHSTIWRAIPSLKVKHGVALRPLPCRAPGSRWSAASHAVIPATIPRLTKGSKLACAVATVALSKVGGAVRDSFAFGGHIW